MQRRPLGATGLQVSRFGLGTWSWGRDTDEYDARDQLTAFVDAGGTLLDTSASYGDGASEGLIGELLRDTVDRDDVVIATKAGSGDGDKRRVRDTSRGALLRALDGSLDRMGVDSVDLWQVEFWSDGVPLEETLSALDAAVHSGRAHYVGVSNYSGWQTAQAATWQRAWPGRARLASTQVEYSLLNREIEHEVVPAALALGLGILAWSPLGRGVLTGKYRTGMPADSRAATPHLEAFVAPYLDERAAGIVEAVCKAADGLALSPVEVSLAWLRDRPGVSAALLGARTAAQLRGALSAEEVDLPQEIRTALDDVSAGDLDGDDADEPDADPDPDLRGM
ncbi:MAG: aldo/keto reductase [Propionibacteriales bacterium]|nr:aldo/keto reductase [Propionibacteriales bacterium]